jgi:hypothetical protein
MSKSMTTTLTCPVAADLHNKIRMLKAFWQKACKIFTKEHNKLWNHYMTCNDFMAHIYSPIQKDDTTVCINTKVSLIYSLFGFQSIYHNAVVPIINISCWDTHYFSVNSMILWYRFPVTLKQQNITICEDTTVLINELQSYMVWTHTLTDRCKYNRTCHIHTLSWTKRFIQNVCINWPYYTFSHCRRT